MFFPAFLKKTKYGSYLHIPFSVKQKGVVKGCTLKIILAVHKPSLYTKLKLYLFLNKPSNCQAQGQLSGQTSNLRDDPEIGTVMGWCTHHHHQSDLKSDLKTAN